MTAHELLGRLGYEGARHFITPHDSSALQEGELLFAIRRLSQPTEIDGASNWRFHGAYVLQDQPGSPAVPAVYFFEVQSDAVARRVHTLVWNQNLTPFIIVISPQYVRLYPGFAHEAGKDAPLGMVAAESAAAIELLAAFRASAIDDGTLWREWGHAVDPARRSDESLLRDLKELNRILQSDPAIPRGVAHGLIGKYVYLYYLRHRDILSDRKLAEWSINPDSLFTRSATLKAFRGVNEELQGWLNGSVYCVGDDDLASVTADQLKLVAGTFAGDSPNGQLHLSFAAYDFAHIPIETLSCVYEQFLHDTAGSGPSRGKQLAAYYTPIPLADYIISEMERTRPLLPGMKVLDPACGSGVFLVQCYRRIIEKERRAKGEELKKSELRDLLVGCIFGVDRDDDACRVTELSLILTLLDYVNPPDLEDTNFKLPSLRGHNIFQDDFFLGDEAWAKAHGNTLFDWCIGNPPWAEVKGSPAEDHDHYPVAKWMTGHEADCPTGGHQLAEAFLWKAATHLTENGIAGLLVPAMTWFKKESVAFRKQFFSRHHVWCLANFANLAYVLFGGRAEVPASAVFYRHDPPIEGATILTVAPFVAEQIANRPEWEMRREKRAAKRQKGNIKRGTIWNIIVSHTDMREVPIADALTGAGLTWKLAMWGSPRDMKLLQKLQRQAPSFEAWCEKHHLIAHQGLELRKASDARNEPLDEFRELIGKQKVSFEGLRGVRRIFAFQEGSLSCIEDGEHFVRKGRAELPIAVSEAPHLIIDASRRFAVFLNKFVIMPPRQIGVGRMPPAMLRAAGLSQMEISDAKPASRLLQLLSIYLSSDFCTYHQFMTSPQWGVDMNRADLDALKKLPVPLESISKQEAAEWLDLHRELTALSEKRFSVMGWSDFDSHNFDLLLADVNTRVFRLLGLKRAERWLVEDFVRVSLELNKGKVTAEAMGAPGDDEVALYFRTLRDSLDGHLDPSQRLHHKLDAITAKDGAFLSVSLRRTADEITPVVSTDAAASFVLRQMRNRLREQHSQWAYFDRGLKRYEPRSGIFYQFKPLHHLHWTRRQAVLDAAEIIAETLEQHGEA